MLVHTNSALVLAITSTLNGRYWAEMQSQIDGMYHYIREVIPTEDAERTERANRIQSSLHKLDLIWSGLKHRLVNESVSAFYDKDRRYPDPNPKLIEAYANARD